MEGKVLPMPENAIVAMLKTLPEDMIVDIFWKTLIENDISPLTDEEEGEVKRGKIEFETGNTIRRRRDNG